LYKNIDDSNHDKKISGIERKFFIAFVLQVGPIQIKKIEIKNYGVDVINYPGIVVVQIT
jgi:hypothetical protein